MTTSADQLLNAVMPAVQPEPATTKAAEPAAQPQPLDLKSAMLEFKKISAAVMEHADNVASEVDKRLKEKEDVLEIRTAETDAVLSRFKSFANETLPDIVKKNVQAAFILEIKTISKDVEDDLKKRMDKAVTDYEERIKKACAVVVKQNGKSLTSTLLHGGKWLVISLLFTFLFMKGGTYLDKREIDFGRKAKLFIGSLPDAKRIMKQIDETKEAGK